MEGHCYTRCGIEYVFGSDAPENIFLYRGETTEPPQIYLQINPDALRWFCIKQKEQEQQEPLRPIPEPAFAEPVFQLTLSSNLSERNDFDRTLATCGYLPLPDVKDRNAYGFRLEYPKLHAEGGSLLFGALFLDFLFDLRHSRVFECCSFAADFDTGLLGHPLANAIHDKAEYRWNRKLYRDVRDRDGGEQARKLLSAEREWLNACIEPEAQVLFKEAGAWFDPIEDEVRRVVFDSGGDGGARACGNAGLWRKIINYQKCLHQMAVGKDENERRVDLYRRVAGWFLARYDLNAAAATQVLHLFHVGRDVKVSGGIGRFRMLLGKGFTRLASVSGSARDVFKQRIMPPMQYGAGKLRQRLSVWIAAKGEKYPWLRIPESFKCISQCLAKVKAGASGIARNVKSAVDKSLVFLSVRIRRILYIGISAASYPLPYHPVARVVTILLVFVFWCYAMGVCGVFDGVTGLRAKGVAVFVISILPALLLLLVIGFFCAWAVLKGRFVRHLRNAMLIIRLGLPRLFFAISGAWMMFYSEGFWSLNVMVGPHDVLFVGVPVLLISLVFTMVKTYNMTGDAVRAVGRSFLMTGMALLISLGVGVVLMSNFIGAAIEETINANDPGTEATAYTDYVESARTAFGTNCLPVDLPGADMAAPYPHLIEQTRVLGRLRAAYILESEYSGCGAWAAFVRHLDSVKIFPAMLLYYSCYAVFFGLFLQLIFGDKEMTESL